MQTLKTYTDKALQEELLFLLSPHASGPTNRVYANQVTICIDIIR